MQFNDILEKCSKHQMHLSIGAVIIVVLIGVFYLYRAKILRYFGTKYVENMDNQDGTNSSAELMLFTVDWCPYCKSAQPEWDALVSQKTGTTINNTSVIFTKVNCTTESPEVAKQIEKYNIQGYPTVKLLLNGQVIDYDAKVTTDNLLQFLTTALP